MITNKKKILYGIILIILVSLISSGCVGKAPSRGGSGPTVSGDTIYIASSEGHIFALNQQSRKDKATFPAGSEWVFPQEGRLNFMYGSPVVDGGSLYFGVFDGKVYALDATTGQKLWDKSFGSQEHIVGRLAVNKQSLFVAAGKRVYALDKLTGKAQWTKPFKAEDRIWSNLVLVGDTLYFGSLDHRIYAISTISGELRWPPFETQGAIAATPLISGGTLYVGSFDKHFYAIDIATGKTRWTEPFQGDNWFWNQAIEYKNRIYVGAMDGKVYAIDAKSGKPAWTTPFEAQSAIRSSLVVVDNVLIVASTKNEKSKKDGKVYGLDIDTGKMRWPVEYSVGGDIVTDLATAAGVVYVFASDEILYGIEVDSGRPLWTFSLKKK